MPDWPPEVRAKLDEIQAALDRELVGAEILDADGMLEAAVVQFVELSGLPRARVAARFLDSFTIEVMFLADAAPEPVTITRRVPHG